MQTKLPNRTVRGTDLVIVVDGQEFRPHADEDVVFRPGRSSVEDYMLQLKALSKQREITSLSSGEGLDDEKIVQLEELAYETARRLCSRIVSWTWTDNDGNPYPSPPTPEIIRSLQTEESLWLAAKASGKGDETEIKNEDSPST